MGKASVLRDADKRLGNPAREIIPRVANPVTVLFRYPKPDTYRAPATQALSTREARHKDGAGRGGGMPGRTQRIARAPRHGAPGVGHVSRLVSSRPCSGPGCRPPCPLSSAASWPSLA